MPSRICCAALAVGAVGALGALAMNAEAAAIERGFEVAPEGLLAIDAEQATVEVRGGSDEVRIAISRGGDDAASIEADFDIALEQDEAGVRLRVARRSGLLRLLPRRGVRIDVQVPRGWRADVASTGASVTVAELAGPVTARTSGGSLRFDDLAGAVVGRTSGGAIRHAGTSASVDFVTSGGAIAIGDVRGEVQAKTSGGRIAVAKAHGGARLKTSGGSIRIDSAGDAVDARTTGGSIRATFAAQPAAASRLATTGGNVDVRLAESVGVEVSAAASGGRVRIDEALRPEGESAPSSATVRVNGGGPSLRLRTSGGSITVAPS